MLDSNISKLLNFFSNILNNNNGLGVNFEGKLSVLNDFGYSFGFLFSFIDLINYLFSCGLVSDGSGSVGLSDVGNLFVVLLVSVDNVFNSRAKEVLKVTRGRFWVLLGILSNNNVGNNACAVDNELDFISLDFLGLSNLSSFFLSVEKVNFIKSFFDLVDNFFGVKRMFSFFVLFIDDFIDFNDFNIFDEIVSVVSFILLLELKTTCGNCKSAGKRECFHVLW